MSQSETRETPVERRKHRDSVLWSVFGEKLPRSEIVFVCQMIMIAAVIVSSIYNLSISHPDSKLWIALLSSSLGYILPNPTIHPK